MIPGIMAGQMRAQAGGGDADPYWANVVSLAHFDTDFVDAKDAVTWTKTGSWIQSDAAAFGGAGAYNPGNNNWVERTIPVIGGQDFTLEFRVRRNAVSKTDVVFDMRTTTSTAGLVLYKDNNASSTLYYGATTLVSTNLGAMTDWTSLCVERDGGTIRLYKDGTSTGEWSGAADITTSVMRLLNSARNSTQWGSQGTQGLLDELRLTIGVARYQGSYTPATSAFPNS